MLEALKIRNEAMDRLAGEMEQVMARMEQADKQANTYGGCGPRLNEKKDPRYGWTSRARPRPSSTTKSPRVKPWPTRS